MRIHEIAKQKNISSKELISLFKKIGVLAKSHLSLVSSEDLIRLDKFLSSETKKDASPTKPKKHEAKTSTKEKEFIKKETSPQKRKEHIAKHKKAKEPESITPREKEQALPKKLKPKQAIVYRGKKESKAEEKALIKTEEIKIAREMPLFEVANAMGKQIGELVLALLKSGMACNKNCILSKETIFSLAHQFGIKAYYEEQSKSVAPIKKLTESGEPRWPIVVVMGHVDHGKTTLLDHIRKMNTAKQEKGGITQRLSAYEVSTNHGKISFLDTPGHEAFSYMRKKGSSATDLAVLVVAIDDGVMPQTVEAIKHAKAAGVPLIAAINKIDKIEEPLRIGEIEKVKRQLAQHDLLPEDWGGDLICVPISATTGNGVNELLEMIILQAQVMELRANKEEMGDCFVLEAKKDKGLGLVATAICTSGTIKTGDYFSCGSDFGKVRLLINSLGQKISSAGPSTPIQIVGFDGKGVIGDRLSIISVDEYLMNRTKAVSRKLSYRSSYEISSQKEKIDLPVIIKADSIGSKEAIWGEIKKLNKKFERLGVSIDVVRADIGGVFAKDIEYASQVDAKLIICLHCNVEKNASALAREKSLTVESFDIIYKLVEFLEELLKSNIEAKIILKKSGEAVVRKVFDLKSRGVIAGCYVTDGVITRGDVVACMRDGEEIGRSKIISLQREKKDIKEIHAKYECGFITDSFHDWQIGDSVFCFKEEKKSPDF